MRECLLAATRQALLDIGYGELNVIEIVNRAGTSRTNFYKHFQDVEEALLELGAEPMEEHIRLLHQYPRGRNAIDFQAVTIWLREIIEFREKHYPIFLALQTSSATHPDGASRRQWETWQSHLRKALRAWINDARVNMEIEDPFPVDDLAEVVAEAGYSIRRRRARQGKIGLNSKDLNAIAELAAKASLRLIVPGL